VENSKMKAALSHALTPILCVGESSEIRNEGKHVEFVVEQLNESLAGITPAQVKKCVIAYEPIWAIGTGKSATPEQAREMHAAIRRTLSEIDAQAAAQIRLLYGGSVKAASAAALAAQPDVDGALVGGASLEAKEFFDIACAMSGQ